MSEEYNSEMEKADTDLVEKAIKDLSEHFESVHISCTRHEGGDVGTVNINKGCGNWFARVGCLKQWLLRIDAKEDNVGRNED